MTPEEHLSAALTAIYDAKRASLSPQNATAVNALLSAAYIAVVKALDAVSQQSVALVAKSAEIDALQVQAFAARPVVPQEMRDFGGNLPESSPRGQS